MSSANKPKPGRIIIPGGMTIPEPHELAVADILTYDGKDVVFISPQRTKGLKTPDVEIGGVQWEIKSPTGNGKFTVEKQLRRADKQSKYIIIDARRTKLADEYIEREVRWQFTLSKSLKRVVVIKKDDSIIEITRK